MESTSGIRKSTARTNCANADHPSLQTSSPEQFLSKKAQSFKRPRCRRASSPVSNANTTNVIKEEPIFVEDGLETRYTTLVPSITLRSHKTFRSRILESTTRIGEHRRGAGVAGALALEVEADKLVTHNDPVFGPGSIWNRNFGEVRRIRREEVKNMLLMAGR